MKKLQWHLLPPPSLTELAPLAEAFRTSLLSSTLLFQRGIQTYDAAYAYFNPSIEQLHDPFLMRDMEKAVDRLSLALERKEKICLYGDYDVDGTTSVALLKEALDGLGGELYPYIPDRYEEGYGLSKAGINYCKEHKINLLICIDCGTRALERVKEARQAGIDVIIADHHEIGKHLPEATALLNPKQSACHYPFPHLSACGIGFKWMQAMVARGKCPQERLAPLLDLVALSSAADIVPMQGENRVLTALGIERLDQAPRAGLALLKKKKGILHRPTVSDIVFSFAPRINAPGRMQHAMAAVELLLASSEEQAAKLLPHIEVCNERRRALDQGILDDILNHIAQDEEYDRRKSTFLFQTGWHKGVLGISASRCIEHHYRPTIILTDHQEMATGSGRSVSGFNLYNALHECRDLLSRYGGHAFAAGFSLPIASVPAFRERFEEVVASSITPEQLTPSLTIDAFTTLEGLTQGFRRVLTRMRPFGPGHLSPVLASSPIYIKNARVIQGKHIKLAIYEKGGSRTWTAIGFNMPHVIPLLKSKGPFSLAYELEENHFMGERVWELRIKDLKEKEEVKA